MPQSARKDLVDFLVERFGSELVPFTHNYYEDLARRLPENGPSEDIANALANALVANGLIDDRFWAVLREERPNLASQIDALAVSWGERNNNKGNNDDGDVHPRRSIVVDILGGLLGAVLVASGIYIIVGPPVNETDGTTDATGTTTPETDTRDAGEDGDAEATSETAEPREDLAIDCFDYELKLTQETLEISAQPPEMCPKPTLSVDVKENGGNGSALGSTTVRVGAGQVTTDHDGHGVFESLPTGEVSVTRNGVNLELVSVDLRRSTEQEYALQIYAKKPSPSRDCECTIVKNVCTELASLGKLPRAPFNIKIENFKLVEPETLDTRFGRASCTKRVTRCPPSC